MQKKIIYSIILLLLFAACKYEDGPAISLRSKYQRLDGSWQIESVSVDGIDSTQKYIDSCNCNMRFARDRSTTPTTYACFMEDCKSGKFLHGDWSFIDHKNKIGMSFGGIPAGPLDVVFGPFKEYYATEWVVLKLTNNAFWFLIQYNDKKYYFKFKK